jgi:hypothetical protein
MDQKLEPNNDAQSRTRKRAVMNSGRRSQRIERKSLALLALQNAKLGQRAGKWCAALVKTRISAGRGGRYLREDQTARSHLVARTMEPNEK